jgi:hypothetical protein
MKKKIHVDPHITGVMYSYSIDDKGLNKKNHSSWPTDWPWGNKYFAKYINTAIG